MLVCPIFVLEGRNMTLLVGGILALLILNTIICYSALCVASEEDRMLERYLKEKYENTQNN